MLNWFVHNISYYTQGRWSAYHRYISVIVVNHFVNSYLNTAWQLLSFSPICSPSHIYTIYAIYEYIYICKKIYIIACLTQLKQQDNINMYIYQLLQICEVLWRHDDAMTWKYFPHYCPFVRGIHWSFLLTEGRLWGALVFFLLLT